MAGKTIKNGVNTDIISKDNTLITEIETKYSANVGDKNTQTNENQEIDEQLDSITFNGSVNTGGGAILVNPVQGNTQTPNIQSSASQSISIIHGKFV